MRVVVGASGRADLVLAGAISDTSRKLLRDAFATGRVRLNGRRARKGDRVVSGDVLEVEGVPDRASRAPVAEPELPLEIVYSDAHVIALSKAPGMPSMPLVAGEHGTLANALVARHPECAIAGDDPREAGLAHRLDAGTSGLILAAREHETWSSLREAFAAGRVEKEYLALVSGKLDGVRVVDDPIAHDAAGGARIDEAGLPAVTEIRPERQFAAYTLVRCLARSGRMHQVRVHLAAAGFPCVGDERYGAPKSELRTDGAFLHAARLALVHPISKEKLLLEAPLPERRARILERL